MLTVGPFNSISPATKQSLIETGLYSRTNRQYKMCKANNHPKSFNISNS
jgi:hypothetical protein